MATRAKMIVYCTMFVENTWRIMLTESEPDSPGINQSIFHRKPVYIKEFTNITLFKDVPSIRNTL